MRAVAIAVGVVALALVILGLIVEAVAWLVAIGVVLLVIAVIAGWVAVRRVAAIGRGNRSA